MKRYLYNYHTITTFGDDITVHAVMLRCQPSLCPFQNIDEEHLVISPLFVMRHGVDAFGNRILYGGTRETHRRLAYVSTGIVSVNRYIIPDISPRPYYAYPSPLTMADSEMAAAVTPHSLTPIEKASEICAMVNARLSYSPSVTNVRTTAREVFHKGSGVCQDYAHLMIALCRRYGLTARYVCGFLEGTGATHAWVEVHDGYSWYGFDPTHNARIDYGYVKIAHGRDADDCPVNRGTYQGCTSQETIVNVTLEQL